MLRLAVVVAVLLAPAVAAAQAPGESTPVDLEIHRAPARTETRPWEVRLGAGVGGGRVKMLGETHGAVGITIDVDALRWFGQVGAGVYVTELFGDPLMPVESMSGKPIYRDLAWEIEPELAVRRSRVVAPHLKVGWQATGSVGVVVAETIETCGHGYEHSSCRHVLERSKELGASAGTSLFAHVGPLALDLGARAQADGAGDAAVALQASAGAVW